MTTRAYQMLLTLFYRDNGDIFLISVTNQTCTRLNSRPDAGGVGNIHLIEKGSEIRTYSGKKHESIFWLIFWIIVCFLIAIIYALIRSWN